MSPLLYRALFLAAALITLPVLVGRGMGRWRYRGSESAGEVAPGGPLG